MSINPVMPRGVLAEGAGLCDDREKAKFLYLIPLG